MLNRKSLKILALSLGTSLALLYATHDAVGQAGSWGNSGNIGAGNLTLNADSRAASNPDAGGGTGPTVAHGTQLTIGLGVRGVRPGSAIAACWSNKSGQVVQIYYVTTSVDLAPATFPWTPTTSGTYQLYCSAQWRFPTGNGGTATTGVITVPVS